MTFKTPYGNAYPSNYGYFQIQAPNTVYDNQLLHRLIWEDFYGILVPEGYVVRFIDGNKLNFKIWNLQCVKRSVLSKYNNKQRKLYNNSELPLKRRLQMSLNNNSTGYYRVYKDRRTFKYVYYEKREKLYITSIDIEKLKEKVINKGLDWYKFSKEEIKTKKIK